MRLFRRTELGGLVVATPQDVAWKEDTLRRREDNESIPDAADRPTSLSSTQTESKTSVDPGLPKETDVPSSTPTSDGSSQLDQSHDHLPTATTADATISTSSPAVAAATSTAPKGGEVGSGDKASVSDGLDAANTSTPDATSRAAPSDGTSVGDGPGAANTSTPEATSSAAPSVGASVDDGPGSASTSTPDAASSAAPSVGTSVGDGLGAASTSTPETTSSAAPSVGTSVDDGLGAASTSTPEASTSAVPPPIIPETSSDASTSIAPVSTVEPAPSATSASVPPTQASPVVTLPTTASEVAPAEVASSVQPETTQPLAQSFSSAASNQHSSSVAAIVPATSTSLASDLSHTSAKVRETSAAPLISSAAFSSAAFSSAAVSSAAVSPAAFSPAAVSSVAVSSAAFSSAAFSTATGQQVALTSQDATAQITAAADHNNPTLATSILKSITKTGSVAGLTTETTSSGIIVTETLRPSNGLSTGAMIGVIVGSAATGLIVAALILFLIRKFMRVRRIARAESPPSSPLLNPSELPLSPAQPLRIEVGMHQRMRSDESDFWVSGQGSNINEKESDGHKYPMPISPLPRLPESQHEMDYGRGMSGVNGGFKFFPKVDRKGEGKDIMRRDC